MDVIILTDVEFRRAGSVENEKSLHSKPARTEKNLKKQTDEQSCLFYLTNKTRDAVACIMHPHKTLWYYSCDLAVTQITTHR